MQVTTEQLFTACPQWIEITDYDNLSDVTDVSYDGPGRLIEFNEPVECWGTVSPTFLIITVGARHGSETFIDAVSVGNDGYICREIGDINNRLTPADFDETERIIRAEATAV